MSLELKDETDILRDAFNRICSKSDRNSLDLTDFICGLIQFGINTLSNKEMENVFNLIVINNEDTINEYNFIKFLTTNFENNNCKKLQMMLLNQIKQHYNNNYYTYEYKQKYTLSESSFFEFSYSPLKSAKMEISKLKLQLREAIQTLKETANINALHIGQNEQVISELKYSLFKQEKEEEAQEILIQSSLEPATTYNPLEWNINDVKDWLQMIHLEQYSDICKINQISGYKLLNWKEQQLIINLQLTNKHDIHKLMLEIDILKQTAPQIYDPNNVSVSSESDDDDDDDDDDEVDYVINNAPKQTIKHQVMILKRKIKSQQNIISKINEINNTEIGRLKSEINRIKLSKLQLIINTSAELQKLRDVINIIK